MEGDGSSVLFVSLKLKRGKVKGVGKKRVKKKLELWDLSHSHPVNHIYTWKIEGCLEDGEGVTSWESLEGC